MTKRAKSSGNSPLQNSVDDDPIDASRQPFPPLPDDVVELDGRPDFMAYEAEVNVAKANMQFRVIAHETADEVAPMIEEANGLVAKAEDQEAEKIERRRRRDEMRTIAKAARETLRPFRRKTSYLAMQIQYWLFAILIGVSDAGMMIILFIAIGNTKSESYLAGGGYGAAAIVLGLLGRDLRQQHLMREMIAESPSAAKLLADKVHSATTPGMRFLEKVVKVGVLAIVVGSTGVVLLRTANPVNGYGIGFLEALGYGAVNGVLLCASWINAWRNTDPAGEFLHSVDVDVAAAEKAFDKAPVDAIQKEAGLRGKMEAVVASGQSAAEAAFDQQIGGAFAVMATNPVAVGIGVRGRHLLTTIKPDNSAFEELRAIIARPDVDPVDADEPESPSPTPTVVPVGIEKSDDNVSTVVVPTNLNGSKVASSSSQGGDS